MNTQSKPATEAPAVSEPVWCEDCDHLHSDRSGHPRYWMCMKHKRSEGYGFVVRGTWSKFSPYMYASDINDGFCPLFERKKNAS
jgi:hypothetical protein